MPKGQKLENKLKEFIRFESPKDGYGIFRSSGDDNNSRWNVDDDRTRLMEDLAHNYQSFPTPYEEGHAIRGDEFCGFKSIEQVYEWFTKQQIQYIVKQGIRIYSITGKTTFVGTNQIIYKKQDIKNQKDITELFL